MIAYHGTRQPPEIILKEGLKPLNPRQVATQILSEYPLHRLPKWAKEKYVEREIHYREEQGLSVHLTLSFEQAKSYSRNTWNGEFESLLRHTFNQALKRKSSYKLLKGVSYVVSIEIPETTKLHKYVDDTIEDIKKRVEKYINEETFEEFRQHSSWGIQVPEVSPEQILKIEKIEWNGEEK